MPASSIFETCRSIGEPGAGALVAGVKLQMKVWVTARAPA